MIKNIILKAKLTIIYKIFFILMDQPNCHQKGGSRSLQKFPFLYHTGEGLEEGRYLATIHDKADKWCAVTIDHNRIPYKKISGRIQSIQEKLAKEGEIIVGHQVHKETSVVSNLFGRKELFSQVKPIGAMVITHPAIIVPQSEMDSFQELYKYVDTFSDDEFEQQSEELKEGFKCFTNFSKEMKRLKQKNIPFQIMKVGVIYFLVDGKNTVYSPISETKK